MVLSSLGSASVLRHHSVDSLLRDTACFSGLWSQVKRAPKAKIKRKTFETPGPEASDGMAMDSRCPLHLSPIQQKRVIDTAVSGTGFDGVLAVLCRCSCGEDTPASGTSTPELCTCEPWFALNCRSRHLENR